MVACLVLATISADPVDFGAVASVDDYRRPGGRQLAGEMTPQTGRGAGHEDQLFAESVHPVVSVLAVAG